MLFRVFAKKQLETFEQLAFQYSTTAHSAKKYVLPHLQTLASYTLNDHSWHKEVNLSNTTPAVFFGMHACDIHGLNRLDRILLRRRYPNPFSSDRLRNTFIVGVHCTPASQCFGTSPWLCRVFHGCDMVLTDIRGMCMYFCKTSISTVVRYEKRWLNVSSAIWFSANGSIT